MTLPGDDLLWRLDALIEQKHLLRHPFYRDWQAGKLPRASLQLYAAQYYRHVDSFPGYLKTLAARTNGSLRGVILQNLAEEEDPRAPHPRLWRDFAAAVGVSEEALAFSPMLPGTQTLVETYRRFCAESPACHAVAALYAYESQVPEIAAQKMDGLRRFYGVTRSEGLAYFVVHQEADKAHRAAWRNWLAADGDGELNGIVAAADEALDALWGALDAVHYPRGHSDALPKQKTARALGG
jgi:pyrroloquinoline-quinone synthase